MWNFFYNFLFKNRGDRFYLSLCRGIGFYVIRGMLFRFTWRKRFLSLQEENAFVSFGRQKVYPDDKRFSLQCWHFKRLASFSKMIRNRLNVFIKHMISNCRYLLIYFLIRKSLHFSILAIINFSLLIINYLVWYFFETKFIDFK